MKKLFLSATAIATVMSASAFAADLPSIKSAPVAPVPLWTGFYAGMNAGYGFGTNNNAYASSLGPQGFDALDFNYNAMTMPLYGVGLSQSGVVSNNQNGFVGGFQTGYNYQFKDKFVVGLEADIQGSNISGSGNRSGYGYNQNNIGSGSATTIGGAQVFSGIDWLGTVRGRLGYLWNPSLMLFGTAGLTYGGAHANVTNQAFTAYEDIPETGYAEGTQPFFGTSSNSQTLVGWNAGGGVEWMLSQNWSVKAEAIYWNLGNMNVATTSVAPLIGTIWGASSTPFFSIPALAGAGNTSVNYQGIIARVGINYHFNMLGVTSSYPISVPNLSSIKSDPAVHSPMWTGFYAGLNSGYGFASNNNVLASSWGPEGFTSTQGPSPDDATMPLSGVGLAQSGSISNNQNGFIGGFQTGYNYQFRDKFVVGLEADIQGTSIRGSGNSYGAGYNQNDLNTGSATTIGRTQVSAGVDWLGTVRGRFGYLWNPSLLVFGTAGLTYGGVNANVTNQAFTAYQDIPSRDFAVATHPFFGTSSQSQTLVGWNAGGGFEWMMSQNWSIKTEAIYWNLGNMNAATTSVAPLIGSSLWGAGGIRTPIYSLPAQAGTGNTNINYQGVIARAGINYHFDFGRAAPVVAKF